MGILPHCFRSSVPLPCGYSLCSYFWHTTIPVFWETQASFLFSIATIAPSIPTLSNHHVNNSTALPAQETRTTSFHDLTPTSALPLHFSTSQAMSALCIAISSSHHITETVLVKKDGWLRLCSLLWPQHASSHLTFHHDLTSVTYSRSGCVFQSPQLPILLALCCLVFFLINELLHHGPSCWLIFLCQSLKMSAFLRVSSSIP